ncbi:conserved hypothetical protein [Bosea sp. 62]|nr:conserved hypothetical protein [Bosea sp. 62]
MLPILAFQYRLEAETVEATRHRPAARRIARRLGMPGDRVVAWGVHAQDNGGNWLTPL